MVEETVQYYKAKTFNFIKIYYNLFIAPLCRSTLICF